MSYADVIENEDMPKVKLFHIDEEYVNGRSVGEELTITVKGTVASFAAAEEGEYMMNELCLQIKSLQIEDGSGTIFEELADED